MIPANRNKIKIIIADDHPVFRSGLETCLRGMPMISKISQASNGDEVIKILKHEHHSLVLMDIKMNPMDGFRTTEIIKSNFPKTKVIALTMFDDKDKVLEILNKGASGYLIKNASKDEIELAINEVNSGKTYFSQDVSKILFENANSPSSKDNKLEIFQNERFRDIIFLLYYELTSEEIAEAMFLSIRTIEDYRSQILNRTNTKSTIGIMKMAIERGIQHDSVLKTKYQKALNKKTDSL
jgi:DNA-binding NarL/FixJ family response regulator